jgi:thymidylate kinase
MLDAFALRTRALEEVKEKISGMGERRIENCRFIARLSLPLPSLRRGEGGGERGEIYSKGVDFNVALSLLKENKVPLIYMNNGTGGAYSEFLNSHEFRKECEKEQNLNRSLRDEWACVKEEFLKAGIESVLIKSVGAFPYESSNLDVLIRQDRRERAESILKELGYIQLHNVEEPYKTLFRTFTPLESLADYPVRSSTSIGASGNDRDEPSRFKGGNLLTGFTDGKQNLAIHLHNKVAWINPFHDEDLLWARYQRSVKDDLVDVPSPEDSILILTAHWFYEDKRIKLSDIMKISSCLKKEDLDWEYMKGVAEKKGWLNGFYFGLLVQSLIQKKLLGESSIDEIRLERMKAELPGWMRVYFNKKVNATEIALPFKLPKIFGKFLHFVKTVRDKTTSPSRKLYELYQVAHGALFAALFYKVQFNIRHQQPMLISISGVDGSGKTTYAKALYDYLIFCELRTKLVWSRVGSSGFLKPFSKTSKILYGWTKGNGISKYEHLEESEARRKDLFKKSSLSRTIGLSLLLFEMLCQYFFKVKLPLLLRKVVICDRYVYDTLIDMATRYDLNADSLEGRVLSRILTALTPKPDVAYVLDSRLEDICHRRKVDSGENLLIREQIKLYKKMSSTFRLQEISNDRAISKITDEMVHEILTRYYKKWEL